MGSAIRRRSLDMLLFAGIITVLGAVAGGYMWEGGKIGLLNQPAEFAIIVGSSDRKSTRLNSSHSRASRMPSSA